MVIGIINSHGLAWAKYTTTIVIFHKKGQNLTVLPFSCWHSIWLRARSHMDSHYTWGSVTTLHEFGGVLGRTLDTFFWALTISWSRLLARVWSGPRVESSNLQFSGVRYLELASFHPRQTMESLTNLQAQNSSSKCEVVMLKVRDVCSSSTWCSNPCTPSTG